MSSPGQLAWEVQWLKDHPEFQERPASMAEFLGPNYLDIDAYMRPAVRQVLIDLFGEEPNAHSIAKYEKGIVSGAIGIGKGHITSDIVQGMERVMKVSDVQVGNELIGSDGKPTTVTGVYPRGVLPVYRVIFTDKSSIVVDGDHLWAVDRWANTSQGHRWRREIVGTAELADRTLKYGDQYVYRIPLVEPVQFEEREFIIDPYLFGVYLGDGDCRGSMRIASMRRSEPTWIEAILNEMTHPGDVVVVRSENHLCLTCSPTNSPNPYLDELNRLGLRGVTSRQKFIPEEYLRGSVEQRLALLRGLMDSDGSLYGRNVSQFSSYSEQLAEGVRQLVLSLGGMATLTAFDRPSHDAIEYHVSVNMGAVCPFWRSGKELKWKPRTNQQPRRAIVSIEPAGEEEVICLSVDAADELYVASEHWILTHNTTIASVALPYMAHWVLCLRDPQDYFDFLPGSRIAFMQMSTSGSQAKEVVFGDIKARIDHSPWFKRNYPYDRSFKNQIRFEQKDVWLLPGDSAETTFEGYNILGGILDEIDSHKITKVKDYAEQGYTTISGRVQSRFLHRGFVLLIGQMKSATGFAAKMFRQFDLDPTAYAIKMTIWESFGWEKYLNIEGQRDSFWYDCERYRFCTRDEAEFAGFPIHYLEVPNTYKGHFVASPKKALRDLAGRPPAVNSPLFHDTGKIHLARSAWHERYEIEEGPVNEDGFFAEWFKAHDSIKRVAHVDVAYSGDGDALGLAMGHVPEVVEVDGEWKPLIVIDMILRIKASPGTEIYLADVRSLIYELKYERKFKIVKVTSDGFESTDFRQQLRRRQIATDILSVDRTMLPYQDLYDAIMQERILIPKYMTAVDMYDPTPIDILYRELSQLQEDNNKVDHPPEGSKDVADAVAAVTSTLMGTRAYQRTMRVMKGSASQSFLGDSPPDEAHFGVPAFQHPAMRGMTLPSAPIPTRMDPVPWKPRKL